MRDNKKETELLETRQNHGETSYYILAIGASHHCVTAAPHRFLKGGHQKLAFWSFGLFVCLNMNNSESQIKCTFADTLKYCYAFLFFILFPTFGINFVCPLKV